MTRDTRNYGKSHPRFAGGGPVLKRIPSPEKDLTDRRFVESATRDSLAAERERDIDNQDYTAGRKRGDPAQYETKPEEMWIQQPDDTGDVDVAPEDYLKPEDEDV